MPITDSEKGTITEAEFVKVAILTSDGRVVPTRPVVDDEHRDFDIHLRKHLGTLATQLKTSLRLRKRGRQMILHINFYLKPPLFTSRRFWYFFAHFDQRTMTFTEPVFLVPSTFVHRHARRRKGILRGTIPFQVFASLAPDAHDKWTPYRLTLAELGPRIVEILEKLARTDPQASTLAGLLDLKGAIIIRKRVTPRSRLRRAA